MRTYKDIRIRIERIENKCDRILRVLTHSESDRRQHEIDNLIERMHRSARILRNQSDRSRPNGTKHRGKWKLPRS